MCVYFVCFWFVHYRITLDILYVSEIIAYMCVNAFMCSFIIWWSLRVRAEPGLALVAGEPDVREELGAPGETTKGGIV